MLPHAMLIVPAIFGFVVAMEAVCYPLQCSLFGFVVAVVVGKV